MLVKHPAEDGKTLQIPPVYFGLLVLKTLNWNESQEEMAVLLPQCVLVVGFCKFRFLVGIMVQCFSIGRMANFSSTHVHGIFLMGVTYHVTICHNHGLQPCPVSCQSVDIPVILLQAALPRRTMALAFCTNTWCRRGGCSSLRGNQTYVLCSTQPSSQTALPWNSRQVSQLASVPPIIFWPAGRRKSNKNQAVSAQRAAVKKWNGMSEIPPKV